MLWVMLVGFGRVIDRFWNGLELFVDYVVLLFVGFDVV